MRGRQPSRDLRLQTGAGEASRPDRGADLEAGDAAAAAARFLPDGHWREQAVLAESWGSALQGRQATDWAVMCGSGVTACHLALSAELAGLHPPRLYVGSWSEWIRDPARPIARAETDADLP